MSSARVIARQRVSAEAREGFAAFDLAARTHRNFGDLARDQRSDRDRAHRLPGADGGELVVDQTFANRGHHNQRVTRAALTAWPLPAGGSPCRIHSAWPEQRDPFKPSAGEKFMRSGIDPGPAHEGGRKQDQRDKQLFPEFQIHIFRIYASETANHCVSPARLGSGPGAASAANHVFSR